MHKKIAAGVVIATAMMPVFVFAQTTDVQSEIQSLMSQIQALQQQLRALVASSTPQGGWTTGSTTPPWTGNSTGGAMPQSSAPCVTVTRNLGIGSSGSDVMQLQNMLAGIPGLGFTASSTGFFGPLTAQAMARFQTTFGIASSTDGSVGPLTRAFFQQRCGGGTNDQGQGLQGQMMWGVSGSSTTPRMPWMGTSTPPSHMPWDNGTSTPHGMMWNGSTTTRPMPPMRGPQGGDEGGQSAFLGLFDPFMPHPDSSGGPGGH